MRLEQEVVGVPSSGKSLAPRASAMVESAGGPLRAVVTAGWQTLWQPAFDTGCFGDMSEP
jgi:hypothetical protein